MIPPCLTLSNIRYVSRVKWSNPGKGVASSPTPRCSSYWKGSLLVALDYSRQRYRTLFWRALSSKDNISIFKVPLTMGYTALRIYLNYRYICMCIDIRKNQKIIFWAISIKKFRDVCLYLWFCFVFFCFFHFWSMIYEVIDMETAR